MNTTTKTICYRGGIVQFRLPSRWREEYEPEGGGTFYEDRPDSGTLRLNVITVSKGSEPSERVIEHSFPAGSCKLLSNGLRMRYHIVAAEERGTPLRLYRWEIAVPVPPASVRIVCFTHTILASQESDPAILAELALVEQSIRNAEFSRESGVTGTFYHESRN
ncbi:MAG: hypothetical protein ACXWDN_01370 [Limisphaerales bacterium]